MTPTTSPSLTVVRSYPAATTRLTASATSSMVGDVFAIESNHPLTMDHSNLGGFYDSASKTACYSGGMYSS